MSLSSTSVDAPGLLAAMITGYLSAERQRGTLHEAIADVPGAPSTPPLGRIIARVDIDASDDARPPAVSVLLRA